MTDEIRRLKHAAFARGATEADVQAWVDRTAGERIETAEEPTDPAAAAAPLDADVPDPEPAVLEDPEVAERAAPSPRRWTVVAAIALVGAASWAGGWLTGSSSRLEPSSLTVFDDPEAARPALDDRFYTDDNNILADVVSLGVLDGREIVAGVGVQRALDSGAWQPMVCVYILDDTGSLGSCTDRRTFLESGMTLTQDESDPLVPVVCWGPRGLAPFDGDRCRARLKTE